MGERSSELRSQNKINFLWDSFVSAENKSYEKGVWLDIFLAEFLAQAKTGKNVNEIIPHSDTTTVSTLIACELLSDVHEICSRPDAGIYNDDLALLRSHLLNGRGWRCLAVIQILGTQHISCAKELASFLVSLYSINDTNTSDKQRLPSSNPYLQFCQNQTNLDIENDISIRLQVPLRKKSRSFQHGSPNDNTSSPSRFRKMSNASTNRRSANLELELNAKHVSSESEAVEENLPTRRITANNSGSPLRSNKNIKIRLDPMDFDYFTCVIRSENDQRLNSESYVPGESKRPKRKCLPEDFYDDHTNDVFKQKMNIIELKFIIIDLLKSLTMSETSSVIKPLHDIDKCISIKSLVFALDGLCQQQSLDGTIDKGISIQLKQNLIGLLLCSLEKLLKLPDATAIIVQKGVIVIMKRLLEDVLKRFSTMSVQKDGNSNHSDQPSLFSVVPEDIEFIYNLLYGGITLLHCLLLQNNSADKLNHFVTLFHQFNSGKLIDRSLFLLLDINKAISNPDENELLLKRCKKVINSIGQLISALIKTRSKIIHVKMCKRSRHKNCVPLNVIHHHETLFGNAYTNYVLSTELGQDCCVATMFMVLAKFLLDSTSRDVTMFAARIMMSCGTCCCFPASQFIKQLISVIQTGDSKMRNMALVLLERTYYRQFGAFHERSSCESCIKRGRFNDYDVGRPSSSLPGIQSDVSVDNNLGNQRPNESADERAVLYVFRDLLLSNDYEISYSVGSHLLRITSKCNLTIQREMLFGVFYPVFLVAKKQFLSNRNEKDKYVLMTCLSAFTNLLSRVRFTEEFLQLNALKHIEELLLEPDLIKLCCSIIEIAIIVQVWKEEHCSDFSDQMMGISDLEMFLGHVKSATVMLLKSVNEYCDVQPLSNVSVNDSTIAEGIEASESFMNDSQDAKSLNSTVNESEKPINTTAAPDHVTFSNMATWDSFSQILENCSVLWRTCTNITLYSPQIRNFFSNHLISKYCFDLLLKTLDGIAKHTSIQGGSTGSGLYGIHRSNNSNDSVGPRSSPTLSDSLAEKFYNANQITLRLFESLLILNLISPPYDEKTGCLMTEDALLTVLRSMLTKALASGHINARHLCDVLLRACSTAPSHRLVLPIYKMPKVGFVKSAVQDSGKYMYLQKPFHCDLTDMDTDIALDCSSSEVMDGMLADELSFDMACDEGYDGDIEVPERYTLDNDKAESCEDDNAEDDTGIRSLASSRKISAIGTVHDFRRDLLIIHPGLCTITIHLLAHHLQKFEAGSGNCSTSGNDDMSGHLSDTVYCLQRLAALCQEASENCLLLNKHNILYQMLTQFKPFLVTLCPSSTGLQHVILNIITRLAEAGIKPNELCQLLGIFTEDEPPVEPLLNALINMTVSLKVQPSSAMSFPTNNITSPTILYSNNREPAEKMALAKRQQHTTAGINSCWSCSSVILGINQELGWSMWASGFSISLWLSVDKQAYLADRFQYGSSYGSHGETAFTNLKNKKRNVDDRSTADCSLTGLLHVVSIGYDLLTIEFWISGITDTMIIVRLVKSDGGLVQEVVAESTIDSQLPSGLWHHMAINVRDVVQKRKVCIEVTILINGCSESQVTLSFTGLLVRKSRPYCVAIGHHIASCTCSGNNCCCRTGGWLLGNLMMFRTPVFSKETAICLLALGPDYAHLTETEVGNMRPNFCCLFTAKMLSSGLSWEKLLNDQINIMKELQEHLLLVFSPQTPNTVRLYPQITSNSSSSDIWMDIDKLENSDEVVSVRCGWGLSQNALLQAARQGQLLLSSPPLIDDTRIVGSFFNGKPASGFRVVTLDKRSSQHLPMCLAPAVNTSPLAIHTHTFLDATNAIGGLSAFHFLFARVVEIEANEEIQARALYLLLKLIMNSAELNSEFGAQGQLKLVTHVISSNKCRPGLHMLKAILDTACDRPGLLVYHIGTGQFQTCNKSGAVLIHPSLITGPILSAWKDWERHSATSSSENRLCLKTLLQSLLILLREDHPQHEFNCSQLNRVNTIDVLLQMCKERFVVDEPSCSAIDIDTCQLLVELIRALMSSPPRVEHISSVVRFLILSHPAQATYVTHIRSSFYFLLPTIDSITTNQSGVARQQMIRRRRQRQQKQHSEQLSLSIENNEDVINQARINILTNNLPSKSDTELEFHGVAGDSANSVNNKRDANLNFPIDPVTLNNALTDLKLRQSINENIIQHEENKSDDLNELNSLTKRADSDCNISGISNNDDLHDGNGCDSGIAGSFKDNMDAAPKITVQDIYEDNRIVHKEHDVINLAVGLDSTPSSSAYEVCEENRRQLFNDETGNNKTSVRNINKEIIYCNNAQQADKTDADNNHVVSNIDVIIEGLLLLLRDFIVVLPDSKAHHILADILKVETLIVMANHPSSRVRVAVIRVLSLYLERATEDELERFLRLKGFYLVANQLHSRVTSRDELGSVAALVTGQHWLPIDNQIPISTVSDDTRSGLLLSPLQLAAIPTLLALIQKSVHDPPLAHSTILFVGRLFSKAVQVYKPLMEAGIIEVLLKTMLAISHKPNGDSLSTPDDNRNSNEMWQQLLINDLHNLFIMIVSHSVRTPGNYHMKVVVDLFLLLSYLERNEQRRCGGKSHCVYILRNCHCLLLATALDSARTTIQQAQQSLPSRIRTTATALLNSVFSNNYDQSSDTKQVRKNSSTNATYALTRYNNQHEHFSTIMLPICSSSSIQFAQSELADRFEFIMTKAVELVINNVAVDSCYSELNVSELNFIFDLLKMLLSSVSCVVDRKTLPRTTWNSVMWSSKDAIRYHTGRLLVWLISPGQPNRARVSAVNRLRNEQKCNEMISFIFDSNHQLMEQFLFYLWDLINGPMCGLLQSSELKDCEEFKDRLQKWGFAIPNDRSGLCCDEDVSLLWDKTIIEQKSWWKEQDKLALKIISKTENITKFVTEVALTVTKQVTDEQNNERKVVMEVLKNDLSDGVHVEILWKKLIFQLTHERAVWHFRKLYPRSWQLDPTEGPCRIRNRLQRCHLTISRKFLKKGFQDKIDAAEMPGPLSYLFDKENSGQVTSMSALMIEKLHTDKKIRHMVTAEIVTPALSIPGELLIGETCIYFVPGSDSDINDPNASAIDISLSSQAWQFNEIKEIHNRRFQLKERALEIFLLNGKTYLLAFESQSERDKFHSELCLCELPNRVAGDHLNDATQLWRSGHLTNWEYLTALNKIAGRSYNDLMQYPVMPFILGDYTSKVLNLNDPNSYRNLEKPMAVQDKKNEQHYINNYNYLKQEQEIVVAGCNQGSYHYGSHYSNSGVVLHFLVRLPPFTGMFVTYQDDNFDLPDRTFHSIETTWRLTSRDSTTDVKELIPEFFCLPEFLINTEGFDFGARQNGEQVDNVTLPAWAENDPRRFVLVHRQALESDYVRENIPHWIDLVFGYKQTGKAAVDAINVFHPATYCGFDVETITDPLERCAWETMVRTYGQTPKQLFKSPHPMCVQSLISNRTINLSHCNIKGVQWGNYVGSPDEPSPSIVHKHQHRLPVTALIPLLTNDVFGLAPSTSLLLTYTKSKSLSLMSMANNVGPGTNSGVTTNTLCVHGAAILFWGHADGVLRVKMRRDLPPCPIVRPLGNSSDVITQCTSAPDTNQLWIGYSSGRILIYKYRFVTDHNSVEFSTEPNVLVGHMAPVLSISLSHSFSVAVTGCQEGVVTLWDMNYLSYIRSLPTISMPVSLTCISETTGDIITVGHDSDSTSSTLRLHSINAAFLGSITTEQKITAICFSTAPEGTSINVIVTGMEDGTIKFWSSWDLSCVGTDLLLSVTDVRQPILCLMYSYDSHHLYASVPSGHVMIWESRTANATGKQPKFLNLSNFS